MQDTNIHTQTPRKINMNDFNELIEKSHKVVSDTLPTSTADRGLIRGLIACPACGGTDCKLMAVSCVPAGQSGKHYRIDHSGQKELAIRPRKHNQGRVGLEYRCARGHDFVFWFFGFEGKTSVATEEMPELRASYLKALLAIWDDDTVSFTKRSCS